MEAKTKEELLQLGIKQTKEQFLFTYANQKWRSKYLFRFMWITLKLSAVHSPKT